MCQLEVRNVGYKPAIFLCNTPPFLCNSTTFP
jgi:hypothetical protein